jgi:hypothetical protein
LADAQPGTSLPDAASLPVDAAGPAKVRARTHTDERGAGGAGPLREGPGSLRRRG